MQDIVRVLRDGTAEFPTNSIMMTAAAEIESLRAFIYQPAANKKSTVQMYQLLVDFFVMARQDYEQVWYSHYDSPEYEQFADLVHWAEKAIEQARAVGIHQLDEDSSLEENGRNDKKKEEDVSLDEKDDDEEEDISSEEDEHEAVPKVALDLLDFAINPIMTDAKTEIDRLRALAESHGPITVSRIQVYTVLKCVMETLRSILPFLHFENIDDEFVDKSYFALKQARRIRNHVVEMRNV